MGSNDPKRQHYIPKMLLNNFLDDSDRIYVYDRERDRIYRTTPGNVFVETNLYTTYPLDHVQKSLKHEGNLNSLSKDYKYERAFGERIESTAKPVISRIIEQARNGKCPELPPELSDIFKRFVVSLARRTPESQERVRELSEEGFDDTFYEASAAVAEKDSFVFLPDRDSIYQDCRIKKLKDLAKSNIKASFAVGNDPRMQDEEERFSREVGLCVAVICLPRRSFVIGSHGITIRQSHSGPMQGSLLPIAHDVAVQLTPSPDKESLLCLGQGSDSLIREINKTTAVQSKIIAGRSEALIRSLSAFKKTRHSRDWS